MAKIIHINCPKCGGTLGMVGMERIVKCRYCNTWSVVDVWRVPKKAYYTVADCFRDPYPMMPFQFAPYKTGQTVRFPVYVTNDTLRQWKGCRLRVKMPGGKELEFEADLGPDMKPVKVGEFSWTAAAPGEYLIKLSLSGPGSAEVENVYELLVE